MFNLITLKYELQMNNNVVIECGTIHIIKPRDFFQLQKINVQLA